MASTHMPKDNSPSEVEAWMRSEIAFWEHASTHTRDQRLRKEWAHNADFWRDRLAEHLRRQKK